MPNYTTSYSNKKRPRYRKVRGDQLPSARKRQQRRRGGSYLRHSQGFGGRRRYGSNERRPYAFIIVGCAFLIFVASVLWYMNRGVDVTLNGEIVSVRINSSIEQLIADQNLELKPGNLLAVDDSILEKGGGERCLVKLEGERVALSELEETELTGGEELEISDGEDVYEEHRVQATAIAPVVTFEGSGAIRYVQTWGIPGRSEIWTGEISGKTQDRGVVKEVVDCVVVSRSVYPDTDEKVVALTFDEGPSENTGHILEILEEKGVRATFFLQGDAASAGSAAVAAIAEAGHEIGSNAFADTDLTALSGEELRAQLTQGFDAVQQAGGGATALLRPPSGLFSEQNWAEGMDLLSAVVTWNVDSGDWLLKGAQSVVDTVVSSVSNGNIVLLTDNASVSEQTVEALPAIIDQLQAEGYKLVSLSDLIATDEDLAAEVSLGKVTMPEDASLPALPVRDEGRADEGEE